MKKLTFLAFFALALFACTTEELSQEDDKSTKIIEACTAPDTNCNGNPDHCDDENGNPIPGCN